jgi:hypothetical protein
VWAEAGCLGCGRQSPPPVSDPRRRQQGAGASGRGRWQQQVRGQGWQWQPAPPPPPRPSRARAGRWGRRRGSPVDYLTWRCLWRVPWMQRWRERTAGCCCCRPVWWTAKSEVHTNTTETKRKRQGIQGHGHASQGVSTHTLRRASTNKTCGWEEQGVGCRRGGGKAVEWFVNSSQDPQQTPPKNESINPQGPHPAPPPPRGDGAAHKKTPHAQREESDWGHAPHWQQTGQP